jgi:hypothetical protein
MKKIMLIVILIGFSSQSIANDMSIDLKLDTANSIVYDSISPAIVTIPEPIEVTIIKKKIAENDKVDVVQQKLWENLVYNIINVILYIFAPVLSALLFWLLRKFGLKVELQTLDDIAAKAALYAEKKSAEWLNQTGNKMDSANKMQWAWNLVNSIDAKLTASDKAKDKLRKIILSKIAEAETKVSVAEAVKIDLKEKQDSNNKPAKEN